MLEMNGLTRRFGDKAAVDGVTLSIAPGAFVAIIGRSGAGKSTLLRMINRLTEPSAGTIRWQDQDVTRLSGKALRAWRARCAMIFQQFNLVGRLDVLTNVLVGRLAYRPLLPSLIKSFTAEERALAVMALDRLGLVDQALQRTDTLSGGQQQRVAIARALVQQPAIMLADEPIASLDPLNAKTVMDALARINREDGITVICNLHDLDAARAYCTRIIGMAAGRVVFDGPAGGLDRGALRAIYGAEAEDMVGA